MVNAQIFVSCQSGAHFKQEYIIGSVSEIFFISHVAFRFQDSFTLMPISEREKHVQGMQKKKQNMGGLI